MTIHQDKKKAKLAEWTNLALGFLAGGCAAFAIDKYFPTFGSLWHMLVFILVLSAVITFRKPVKPDVENKLKVRLNNFGWVLVIYLACYALMVGISLLFGSTVISASRIFIIGTAVGMTEHFLGMHQPEDDDEEDLYTEAKQQLEREKASRR